MAKTFDQSLIDTATIPMSMIDPEDMADKTSEEFASMRRVQQGCHYELTNREDFPFNKMSKNIRISKNNALYSMVEGKISKVIMAVNGRIYELPYKSEVGLLEDKTGRPECYTIQYNPEKIKLYPTPDDAYNISIDYITTKNVVLENGDYSYTIENNSTLRMPERFQHLYFDALEYYVLATNMRKMSNPRWQPTLEIFKQRWATFLRGCNSVEAETIFTI